MSRRRPIQTMRASASQPERIGYISIISTFILCKKISLSLATTPVAARASRTRAKLILLCYVAICLPFHRNVALWLTPCLLLFPNCNSIHCLCSPSSEGSHNGALPGRIRTEPVSIAMREISASTPPPDRIRFIGRRQCLGAYDIVASCLVAKQRHIPRPTKPKLSRVYNIVHC